MRHLFLSGLAVLAMLACAGQPGRRAVATVNGEAITAADIAAMLPRNLDPDRADTVKKQVLDGIISRKLFAQEAKREGMEKDVAYEVEEEQKALMEQRLYDTITAPGNRLTDSDVQSAYKLLQTEVHLKRIAVPDESLADRLAAELDRGARFESLAVRYSTRPSAVKAGDEGFTSLFDIREPLRASVMALSPGGRTKPTQAEGTWQIALLVESRPATPPPLDNIRPQLEAELKKLQRRELADEYLAKLRKRLVYNPEGLNILCKPIDSITDAEKEVAVAYKDGSQFVKVKRLLAVAAQAPVTLDTAMKKYNVRRAIEEDLMYEDGLRMGLDKAPDITRQLAAKREDVLYNALYKKEITDKLVVTDSEVAAYYQRNRENFTSPDFNQVAGTIRSRLLTEARDARFQQYLAELKAKSKIAINQAALAAVKTETKATGKPQP